MLSSAWPQVEDGAEELGGGSDAPVVYLLADDLTGACDAAVAFAARGYTTEVAIGPGALPTRDAEVWAWSTGTRDLPAEQAAARLKAALHALPRGGVLFKKIDSVFRGNTFAETVTTLEAFPEALCLIAPAFPALGRTAREGVVQVVDLRGEHFLDVVAELEQRGCALPVLPSGLAQEEIAEQLRQYRADSVGAVFCDAETQDDLQRLAEAARTVNGDVVWIGAGGLAHALAASLRPQYSGQAERAARNGDLLFFVGSDHAVTLAQVRALREHASRAAAESIVIVEVVRGVTTAEEIGVRMAGRSADGIGCMLMTGGDTAAFVCEALGIRSLRLEREFAPGLPEGVACGGAFEGVALILKSGGFGEEDVLCRIAQTFDSAVLHGDNELCACAPQGGLQ